MKLTFLGAAREVTGSCYMVEVNDKRILVDCGMVQGAGIYEEQHLRFNPAKISHVVITHAHIDHTGLLPMLAKRGFTGKVYMTRPTRDLANIMLKDSAHIQSFEAEWRNRRAERGDQKGYSPLYTFEEVQAISKKFKGCDYETPYEILKGVTIKFRDAGHLLGSAGVEMTLTEDSQTRTLVFSGDIGNGEKPIICSPLYFDHADYVVMESTYGDKDHVGATDYTERLAQILDRTFRRGGNVIIPAFAVGRTQELLYCMREIKARNMVKSLPNFKVYLDSPLANEATDIYSNNYRYCYDDETLALMDKGINPLEFDGLKTSLSTEDSKALNFDAEPKVIMSASGMCEAGRIRHHLKHNLWKAENTVVFVGYQVAGTLGRAIQDGALSVKLFGERVDVNCDVVTLEGMSSHADKTGLLTWLSAISATPKRVFVTHGDEAVSEKFVQTLCDKGYSAIAPLRDCCWNLYNDTMLREGTAIPQKDEITVKASTTYKRLLDAEKKLSGIVKRYDGASNFDLNNFADELEKLCDKWEFDKE